MYNTPTTSSSSSSELLFCLLSVLRAHPPLAAVHVSCRYQPLSSYSSWPPLKCFFFFFFFLFFVFRLFWGDTKSMTSTLPSGLVVRLGGLLCHCPALAPLTRGLIVWLKMVFVPKLSTFI